jgi:hypothetical protein
MRNRKCCCRCDGRWTWRSRIIAGLTLAVIGVGSPAIADSITVQSDANTLGAALGPVGAPSPTVETQLDAGDTSGLTFTSAAVGSYGTFTPVPPGAPVGTEVLNIPPAPTGDGGNGFFEVTFTLPTGFTGASIMGAANADDLGRVFLNGNPLSPSLFSGDPNTITEFGNAAFSSSNAAYFQAGQNVLLVADANTGGGPSGAAFYATVTYNTANVPEPGVVALLAGMLLPCLVRRRRRK